MRSLGLSGSRAEPYRAECRLVKSLVPAPSATPVVTLCFLGLETVFPQISYFSTLRAWEETRVEKWKRYFGEHHSFIMEGLNSLSLLQLNSSILRRW